MSKIIIATAIRDIAPICKKDDMVSIHTKGNGRYSITTQDGNTYDDTQVVNSVGYVSLDKLFVKCGG